MEGTKKDVTSSLCLRIASTGKLVAARQLHFEAFKSNQVSTNFNLEFDRHTTGLREIQD
jgi:hypothetical protein